MLELWFSSSLFLKKRNLEFDMISIRCKKCGWRLPFSSKATSDSVQLRGKCDIVCPKCGILLIRKGGRFKRWY